MSFNAIVSSYSFNLLFFTQVLTVLSSTIKYNEYITDKGKNITIPCLPTTKTGKIMWIKEDNNDTFQIIQKNINLIFINITTNDAGIYSCLVTSNSSEFINDIQKNESELIYLLNETFLKVITVKINVRTVPGPVSRLSVRMSTILGVLIWDYKRNNSGGYPLKSFTVEIRPYNEPYENQSEWERLDPINISPNVRYMEIYHLVPNKSYEFQIWANNYLGVGEKSNIIVTTLPEIGDEDLIRIIMRDAKDFDPHIWLYAVSVVMGTMISLGLAVCLLLIRDCYLEEPPEADDDWDSLDLIPNIILNPGFYESDDPDNPSPPYTRTIIFGEDVISSSEDESDREKLTFKRKLSIFFQGDTIKRL